MKAKIFFTFVPSASENVCFEIDICEMVEMAFEAKSTCFETRFSVKTKQSPFSIVVVFTNSPNYSCG